MLQTRLALAALFFSACALPALAQSVAAELVADLDSGQNLRWSNRAENLTTLNGVALFSIYDRTHGVELWVTKGNADTRLLGDICPGSCSSSPREFRSDRSELFFLANDGFVADWDGEWHHHIHPVADIEWLELRASSEEWLVSLLGKHSIPYSREAGVVRVWGYVRPGSQPSWHGA